MRIGMVFDLRDDYRQMGYSEETLAEFDSEETITAIETALIDLGYQVERVGNIQRLVTQLSAGKRWDLVFNTAEGMHGLAREAQVPALLDAYQIPYTFSSADVMVITLNKALAKQILVAAGVPTAQYTVITDEAQCTSVTLPYPLFAKPLAEGTGKGVSQRSLVHNSHALRATCRELLATFAQPVLVETFLSGREFTVGIVGAGKNARSIGAEEVLLKAGAEPCGHTFQNKENCETLVDYRLCHDGVAKAAETVALDAWRTLGCVDAGRIDIRCDAAGNPYFLEVNPLAGLHPTHSDLPILATEAGISYKELIHLIMQSAIERIKKPSKTTCGSFNASTYTS